MFFLPLAVMLSAYLLIVALSVAGHRADVLPAPGSNAVSVPAYSAATLDAGVFRRVTGDGDFRTAVCEKEGQLMVKIQQKFSVVFPNIFCMRIYWCKSLQWPGALRLQDRFPINYVIIIKIIANIINFKTMVRLSDCRCRCCCASLCAGHRFRQQYSTPSQPNLRSIIGLCLLQ